MREPSRAVKHNVFLKIFKDIPRLGGPIDTDNVFFLKSCKGYAHWRARQAGDMLPEDKTRDLTLFWGLCALDVAIRDGLELLPAMD